MEHRSVGGYLRVSYARDGMKAPELYEDEIPRYCSYRDLELGEIFSDIDYSVIGTRIAAGAPGARAAAA